MKTNREVLIWAGLLLASAIIITTHTTNALSNWGVNPQLLVGTQIEQWSEHAVASLAEDWNNIATWLVNNLTKTVEFNMSGGKMENYIFSWTYKAPKSVKINWITVVNNGENSNVCYNDMILHVSIYKYENPYTKDVIMNSCSKNFEIPFGWKYIKLEKWEYIKIVIAWELNTGNYKWGEEYSTKLKLYGTIWNEDLLEIVDFAPIKIVNGNNWNTNIGSSDKTNTCDINRDEKVDVADFVTILNCMAADSNSESCDLNGDEKVDIADTVTMLNCMAEGDSSSDDTRKCDVNKDKKVDIADYVTMLNIMTTDDYITGGDLNDDWKIDIADIVTILNCMADGDSSSESSDEEINKCDINGDKKVDIADYVTILNCMAADSSSERCDVNEDWKVDIADHVSVLNCMAVGKEIDKCDVNADWKVDTGDFQTVLNIMAANSYTKTADLNGDKKIDIADWVSVLNCIAAENAKNVANGLVNKLTKTVEFNANKTETKVIFSGTYKASKTVSIEWITITNNNAKGSDTCYNDFIIHVFIDWEDIEKNTVINSCTKTTSMKFKEKIDLKKWEYIEIKIKWELNSAQFRHSDKKGTYSATLTLYGDNLPNTYGTSLYTENSTSADFAPIKIVSDGSEDSEKSNPKEPSEILQNWYSRELNDAYDFARSNKITTMNSIEDADMNWTLNRAAMAKMLSNYAINSLGLEPDTTKDCYFSDVSSNLDRQYDNWITKACQLGLMWVWIKQFYPNWKVTRAEFWTVLSRALNANNISKLAKMNDASPYYYDHLRYLNEEWIMNNISNPSNFELRGRVMLMLNRSAE